MYVYTTESMKSLSKTEDKFYVHLVKDRALHMLHYTYNNKKIDATQRSYFIIVSNDDPA